MNLKLMAVTTLGSGIVLAACANTTTPFGETLETSPSPSASPITSPSPNAVSPNGDTLTVTNQPPGNRITVASATFSKPGFIMIHQDNNGQPGTPIGTSTIFTGTQTNIPITLNQQVTAGTRLYAMLHYDVNNNTRAEYPGPDVPVTDEDGNAIQQTVTIVTASPSPSPTINTRVTTSPTPSPTIQGAPRTGRPY